jgi:hypothetical protein
MNNFEVIDCLNKYLPRASAIRLKCCNKVLYTSVNVKGYNHLLSQLDTSDLKIMEMIILTKEDYYLYTTPVYNDNNDFYRFVSVYRYLKAFKNGSDEYGFRKNHYNYLVTFCIYKYIVMEYLGPTQHYLGVYSTFLPIFLTFEIFDLHINHPYKVSITNIYSLVNKYEFDDSVLPMIYI